MNVSVIIPVYNGAQFVEAAIASAQRQSVPPLEIVVIDDCSIDDTADVVRAAIARDPSIRLLHTARNSGPGAARNLGLAAARGDWIALLDADDTFDPERLATLTALGRRECADMVSDNLLLILPDATVPAPMYGPDDLSKAPFELTATGFITGCTGDRRQPRKSLGFMQPLIATAFLRRHAIAYADTMRFGEDFTIYLACLVAGAKWVVTPRAMYHYRIRAGSLTEKQASADLLRLRNTVQKLLDDPSTRHDRALVASALRYRKQIERQYFYRAFTDAVKARERRAALRLFFANRNSAVHIMAAGIEQTPTILRKASAGGYLTAR